MRTRGLARGVLASGRSYGLASTVADTRRGVPRLRRKRSPGQRHRPELWGIADTSTLKAPADAAALAARIAATVGTGETVLRTLTGRGTLPRGFFVL
jgi:hypothetical protein